jgi:tRNA pseudouridine38/39 synthase
MVKPIDKHRTRHIALQFSYDGTIYSGFAQNVGKEYDNSVEKHLFAALEKTRLLVSPDENGMLTETERTEAENGQVPARTASKYSRCGRTDKGVHANGQVVALYLKSAFPLLARVSGCDSDEPGDVLVEESLPKNSLDFLECFTPPRKKNNKRGSSESQPAYQRRVINEYDYCKILNNVLPSSIRMLGWCPVSAEFSARFSCSRRTYRYFFPRRNLDLSLMATGLKYMMGRNDFRNFCKMNCEQVSNFERVLVEGKVVSPQHIYCVTEPSQSEATIENSSPPSPRDMCHIEIVGQAFLWHQIRCIMSILFYIGRGQESPKLVKELLDVKTNPAKPSYDLASEAALVLQDCTFSQLHLGRSVRNLWDVQKTLEQRWEKHAIASERAKNALDSIKDETYVRWTDVVDFVEQIDKDRRRKIQKRSKHLVHNDGEVQRALETNNPQTDTITWGLAVDIIQNILGVYPYAPNGSSKNQQKGQTESSVHQPLTERSKGTTYEEKVQSILESSEGKSTKRKERYEENIIKKRKTAEEDKAFYDHKLRQGGSSM